MKRNDNIPVLLKKAGALLLLQWFLGMSVSFAQLSPGDLTQVHAHLEGMSNCTECHILGNKVTNEKCLHCHRELQSRINQQKGYHASAEIAGKACVSCHSDHHGRKFEIIRFDTDNFNHRLTGYTLSGAHEKLLCNDCHKKEFIADADIRKKEMTYLGLGTSCLDCHEDHHRGTLSSDCLQCHTDQVFKPAARFDHNKANFVLRGKHKDVACSECHKTIVQNGHQIQQFTGLAYASCTNCHIDVHNNKFGSNCTQCHSEQSFHIIKSMTVFNHDLTNFPLEGKHKLVECKACHKTKYTDHLKHSRCTDCHSDYHEGQFARPGQPTDCADCHTTNGFTPSLFTLEMHAQTGFVLDGAHLATPCIDCHKSGDKWDFSRRGEHCTDCHDDIHRTFIEEKYYPQAACTNCHTKNRWTEVVFDHALTGYVLEGKHKDLSCTACHFKTLPDGSREQQFKSLTASCVQCHRDEHFGQFAVNNRTDCLKCHGYNNWHAEKFDHNNTRFPLDGKHKNVACSGCHKTVRDGFNTYTQYKLTDITCASCH